MLGVSEDTGAAMRLALMTDIHANRQAFEACLADAAKRNIDRYIFLGDYVGYNADPGFVVDHVQDLVARGAVALLGNHDSAIGMPGESMNEDARTALDWSREQLSESQRAFLAALPLEVRDEDRHYVHSEASKPAAWIYVMGLDQALRSIRATDAAITFCGHIHVPAIYSLSLVGKIISFTPVPDVPVPLFGGRQWLAVLGAVGQPRDGNPAACYATFDAVSRELTYHRVPYDIDTAAKAVIAAGLPQWLAMRLYRGR
jgi:diadenosine tetraphosphatase ApaH/serine/threonine PP2A family protein phosphatase